MGTRILLDNRAPAFHPLPPHSEDSASSRCSSASVPSSFPADRTKSAPCPAPPVLAHIIHPSYRCPIRPTVQCNPPPKSRPNPNVSKCSHSPISFNLFQRHPCVQILSCRLR